MKRKILQKKKVWLNIKHVQKRKVKLDFFQC